ncbi:tetratricopeptide repeat protein [Fusobacterium sp. PH5-44]|uniref:tetratricopeptide repeat protein n=1 Tax=unclassified Fusobacterium TaxID=2648384 RepID=UPI003D1A3633
MSKKKDMIDRNIKKYTEKIKNNPDDFRALFNRGIQYMELGSYKEAIRDYNKAIKLAPKDSLLHYNRGLAKSKIGKYEEAIEDYTESIYLNSKYASAFYNRGLVKAILGKHEDAILDYNAAVKLNLKNHDIYYNRGKSNFTLRRYEYAMKDFGEAIKFEMVDENTLIALGRSKAALGRYKDAVNDYSEAIKLNSKNALAYYYRGRGNSSLGLYKDSIYDYTKAVNEYEKILTNKNSDEKLVKEANIFMEKAKDEKKLSEKEVSRRTGFLTFADILGWKGIWQREKGEDNELKFINKLIDIKNRLSKLKDAEINLISDTFVVASVNLRSHNKVCKMLIEECLKEELAIRGATSYGTYYKKSMVYIGQTVDEAASWHEKGEELGIFFTHSARLRVLENPDVIIENINLRKGEVVTKFGKMSTYYIDWYNDKDNLANFYNIMKKNIIYPEISQKYVNTEYKLNMLIERKNKK